MVCCSPLCSTLDDCSATPSSDRQQRAKVVVTCFARSTKESHNRIGRILMKLMFKLHPNHAVSRPRASECIFVLRFRVKVRLSELETITTTAERAREIAPCVHEQEDWVVVNLCFVPCPTSCAYKFAFNYTWTFSSHSNFIKIKALCFIKNVGTRKKKDLVYIQIIDSKFINRLILEMKSLVWLWTQQALQQQLKSHTRALPPQQPQQHGNKRRKKSRHLLPNFKQLAN